MSVSAQEGSEGGAVGAGALDAERDDLPERVRPGEKLFETAGIGGNGEGSEDAADGVEHRGDVDVLVGIDADDDVPGVDGFECAHRACLP